jgi:hypothetical protein
MAKGFTDIAIRNLKATRAAKSLIPVRMAFTWSCSRAKKILLPFAIGSAARRAS